MAENFVVATIFMKFMSQKKESMKFWWYTNLSEENKVHFQQQNISYGEIWYVRHYTDWMLKVGLWEDGFERKYCSQNGIRTDTLIP